MKHLLFPLAISFVLVFCDKGNLVTIEPVVEINFSVGSSWQYVWTMEMRDSLGNLRTSASDTVFVRVAARDEIVGSDSGLIRFEAYSVPHYRGTQNVWYKPASEQFLEVAYSRAGSVPISLPKRDNVTWSSLYRDNEYLFFIPRSVQILMKTKSYDDSILFRNDKRIVYKYPLSVGSSWISFQDPFLQTREVIGLELLESHGIRYDCAKIQTRLPSVSPDLEWFDHVSSLGLIRRSIRIPKIPVTSPDDPERTKGWITIMEYLDLLSQASPN